MKLSQIHQTSSNLSHLSNDCLCWLYYLFKSSFVALKISQINTLQIPSIYGNFHSLHGPLHPKKLKSWHISLKFIKPKFFHIDRQTWQYFLLHLHYIWQRLNLGNFNINWSFKTLFKESTVLLLIWLTSFKQLKTNGTCLLLFLMWSIVGHSWWLLFLNGGKPSSRISSFITSGTSYSVFSNLFCNKW